jgi:hypothetical protein
MSPGRCPGLSWAALFGLTEEEFPVHRSLPRDLVRYDGSSRRQEAVKASPQSPEASSQFLQGQEAVEVAR